MTTTWPNAACWVPSDALAMVNIEAGTPDQANDINRGDHVFLAGHQSPAMQFLEEDDFQRDRPGSPSSQEDVLTRLADRSRSMLFITGAPGTGKSHLVRWLHIHATAEPEASKRRKDLFAHVPRSMTNLADVLQVILEHAEPEDREEIRGKISKATGDMKSDQALRGRLLMTLATRLHELRAEIEAEGASHQFGKIGYIEVLRLLPDFLASGAARSLYLKDGGPADRIVRVRLQERTEGDDVADVQLRFTREDLLAEGELAELEDGLLGKHDANCRARLLSESDFMNRSIELMDYCVDGAVRELVGLDATQLQVAMGRLLDSLAERGQRLVLFFEDWGLIAGFQNQLAEAFAAATAKGSVLAVIAITKQRLGQFQGNILQRGWIYSLDQMPDEQRRASVDDLLARNLNAIRLGPKRLRAMFNGRSDGAWIANACDECPLDAKASCHAAFGTVEIAEIGEVGLFPMTTESITAALRRKFADDTDLIPRIVLSGIVRIVLGPKTADDLKSGSFPTARFADDFAPQDFRLKHVERNLIERALDGKAPEQLERWTAFLETYRATTRLQSHSALAAQAFGLLPIPDLELEGSVHESAGKAAKKGGNLKNQQQDGAAYASLKPSPTMDGAIAFQQERPIANEDRLRAVIASAVRSAMLTDGRLNDEAWADAPDGFDGNDVGLGSSSRRHRSLEIVLDAATHGDVLRSLVHMSEGGSWSQLDLPRDRRLNAEQAVDGWARHVERELLGERHRTEVAGLLRLLLIMGIASDGVARFEARNAMDVALGTASRSQPNTLPPDSLSDASVRAMAQEMLLRRISFSQGRGAPVAIDVATLWPILTAVLADLRLPEENELPASTHEEVLISLKDMVGDLEKRTTGLVKHLETWWTVNGADAPHLERIEELIAVEEQLSARMPLHPAGQSQAVKTTIAGIRKQRVEVSDQVQQAQSEGLLALVLNIPYHVKALQGASLAERLALSVEFDRVRPLMTTLHTYLSGVRTLVSAVAAKQAPGSSKDDEPVQEVPEPPLDRARELATWAAQHPKKGVQRGR